MPIKLSDQAKFQLKKRRISKKIVLETIRNPHEIKQSYKNRRLRRRLIGDKIFQVVTITEGSMITVISGYYLRKI